MTLASRVDPTVNSAAEIVRPVFIVYLNFATDILRAWTGPGDLVVGASQTGDSDLDGNTFKQIDAPFTISDMGEDMTSGSKVTITYSASPDSAAVVRQIVRDDVNWQLRTAKIWVGFLQSDLATMHNEVKQLFGGVMVSAQVSRKQSEGAIIQLTLDSDLRNARGSPVRWVDHQRFYSTDTFSTFIIPLANGKLASGQNRPSGGAGGGGAFSNAQGIGERSLINHL